MASKKKPPAKAGSTTDTKASAKAPPKQPATPSPTPAKASSSAAHPARPKAAGSPSSTPPKAPRPRRPPVHSLDVMRPDPDQPPAEGAMERSSVYSEWLNQAPRAPTWLNSPPPRKPSPTARRRAAAKAAEPPDPMQQVLNDQPAPSAPADDMTVTSASRPAPRRRTTARRITQGERMAVTSAELEAVVIGSASRATTTAASRVVAPLDKTREAWSAPRPVVAAPVRRPSSPPPAMTGSAMPPSYVAVGPSRSMPGAASQWPVSSTPRASEIREPGASSGGNSTPVPPGQRTSGRYSTMPQPPATPGQSTGRIPSAAGQTGARLPVTRSSMRPAIDAGATGNLPVAPHPEPGVPAARTVTDSEALLIRGARRPPVSTTGPMAPRRKGPHPILAQVLVAAGTIIILLITVTLTSPLGYGAAISGTFQAYAQPFIMVPTPTPTPSPTPMPYTGGTGVSPGSQVVIADINAVFGQYAPGALNVARCESGYDPNARNPYAVGDSHAEGVFQILFPSTWDGTSYRSQNPYNYDANIHAAYEIFSRDGYSWREWQCQP